MQENFVLSTITREIAKNCKENPHHQEMLGEALSDIMTLLASLGILF